MHYRNTRSAAAETCSTIFCLNCLNSIRQILKLTSRVDQMVTEVEDLRQEVSSLKVVVLDLQNLKGLVEKLNTTVNSKTLGSLT